mmetsp:Transcript_18332/g.25765  ORF Transcript_18332/g.25765 Transcript_18332/m.25765 type:complete len:207 (-) Transcript_18332:210-830(-)
MSKVSSRKTTAWNISFKHIIKIGMEPSICKPAGQIKKTYTIQFWNVSRCMSSWYSFSLFDTAMFFGSSRMLKTDLVWKLLMLFDQVIMGTCSAMHVAESRSVRSLHSSRRRTIGFSYVVRKFANSGKLLSVFPVTLWACAYRINRDRRSGMRAVRMRSCENLTNKSINFVIMYRFTSNLNSVKFLQHSVRTTQQESLKCLMSRNVS